MAKIVTIYMSLCFIKKQPRSDEKQERERVTALEGRFLHVLACGMGAIF